MPFFNPQNRYPSISSACSKIFEKRNILWESLLIRCECIRGFGRACFSLAQSIYTSLSAESYLKSLIGNDIQKEQYQMFLSGFIWTKSSELLAYQRGRKPVLPGCSRGGFFLKVFFLFFLKSSSVSSSIVQIHFLLHRQAGMLTHKPCKELKLARADGKKTKE